MIVSGSGVSLNAEVAGSGDLTLVFLHYWGGAARTWAPVITALPSGLRTVALDARGWGRSDHPDGGYDTATMADDAEAAIAALKLESYVLVGHSMGGKVAQLLATRRPRGLAGVILVAPSPAQGKSLGAPEREGMMGAYATADTVAWTMDNVLTGRTLPTSLREQVVADSLAGGVAAKAAWPARTISEDVSADLARIAVPILVIGGEIDKVDSVDMLRRLVLPSLPAATLTVVPGAGHLLPLEAPREVADHISGFVASSLGVERVSASGPEDLPRAFDAAFNRGDLDAVVALFHANATMRMTEGSVVQGPEALRDALGDLISKGPKLRNTVRRSVVSGDIALLLLDWSLRFAVPDGDDMVQHGVATQVAERQEDGRWLLRISNPSGAD